MLIVDVPGAISKAIRNWGPYNSGWIDLIRYTADKWQQDSALAAEIVSVLADYAKSRGDLSLEYYVKTLETNGWPSLAEGLKGFASSSLDVPIILAPVQRELEQKNLSTFTIWRLHTHGDLENKKIRDRLVDMIVNRPSDFLTPEERGDLLEELAGWGMKDFVSELEIAFFKAGVATISPERLKYIRAGVITPNNFNQKEYPELAFKPAARLLLARVLDSGGQVALTEVLVGMKNQEVFANPQSRSEMINVLAGRSHLKKVKAGSVVPLTAYLLPECVRASLQEANLGEFVKDYDKAYEMRRSKVDLDYKPLPMVRRKSWSVFGGFSHN